MEAASRAFSSRFQLRGTGAWSFHAPAPSLSRTICFSLVNDTEERLVVSVTRRDDEATLSSCIPPGRCTFVTEPASFDEHCSQLLRIEKQLFELRYAENNGYHFAELVDPELAASPGRYAIVQEEPREVLGGATYLRCHAVRAYCGA